MELDGRSHLESAQALKDRVRNNAGVLTGYSVLRYGYRDVVYNQQRVLGEVWQVLRGRVSR